MIADGLLIGLLFSARPGLAEPTLTVMSFDVWRGGANEGKPVDETVAADARPQGGTWRRW